MTQTIDALGLPAQAMPADGKPTKSDKTGAETARNGNSFLAIIEKMLAGTRDGKSTPISASALNMAGRGAGDRSSVPGEKNTLTKRGAEGLVHPAVTSKDALKSRLAKRAGADGRDKTDADKLPLATYYAALLLQTPEDGLKELKASGGSRTGTQELRAEYIAGNKIAGSAQTALEAVGTDFAATANVPAPQTDGKSAKRVSAVNEQDGTENRSVRSDRKKSDERRVTMNFHDSRSIREQSVERIAGTESQQAARINGDGTADISISFRAPEQGSEQRFQQAVNGQEGKASSFASMLSDELRSVTPEFVRAGAIILKDNNSGLIRLTLHPESLGNVRIALELSDRKVSGKIIVSSKEAFEAFNENLDGFRDAFIGEGFDSAGFDLSWNGESEGQTGSNPEKGTVSAPFYASTIPDVMLAANPADIQESGYSFGRSAVNVFA